jgi:hypothetical protein
MDTYIERFGAHPATIPQVEQKRQALVRQQQRFSGYLLSTGILTDPQHLDAFWGLRPRSSAATMMCYNAFRLSSTAKRLRNANH